MCFSVCPLPQVLSLGTTEKSLALLSLPFRYLYTLIISLLSFHTVLFLLTFNKVLFFIGVPDLRSQSVPKS